MFIVLHRSRGLATGISAGLNYVFAFIATKTYLNVERDLGLSGAPWFYAAFALTGAIILYFILPETEGRTLEDIERHYSERGRRITDLNIVHGDSNKTDNSGGYAVYKKTTVE